MIVLIVAGTFLLDVVAIVAPMRMGQGGSRLSAEPGDAPPTGPDVIGDRTDDRHWKWGLFYSNPNDPALWVEKRFGIGWTINMARPGAWLTIIAILTVGLVVPAAIALIARLTLSRTP